MFLAEERRGEERGGGGGGDGHKETHLYVYSPPSPSVTRSARWNAVFSLFFLLFSPMPLHVSGPSNIMQSRVHVRRTREGGRARPESIDEPVKRDFRPKTHSTNVFRPNAEISRHIRAASSVCVQPSVTYPLKV